MRRRILTLTAYFLRRLTFSLAGLGYLITALLYWGLLFPPGQSTPDIDYYVLVIGVFGGAAAFMTALTVSARANRAANYPMVVRLNSRVEYLTAVLLSSMLFTLLLQSLVSVLALVRGPNLPLARLLEIPPIWLPVNILAAVLALHATDFIAASWSRVYIYGILAIFLFGQTANQPVSKWLSARMTNASRAMLNNGWFGPGSALSDLAGWLSSNGASAMGQFFGFLFWPFKAVAEATAAGVFEPVQALAPAVLLLYATILFLFAADFFASKDLDFVE